MAVVLSHYLLLLAVCGILACLATCTHTHLERINEAYITIII